MIDDPIKDALLSVPEEYREAVFAAAKALVGQEDEGTSMRDRVSFASAAVRVAWAIVEQRRLGPGVG